MQLLDCDAPACCDDEILVLVYFDEMKAKLPTVESLARKKTQRNLAGRFRMPGRTKSLMQRTAEEQHLAGFGRWIFQALEDPRMQNISATKRQPQVLTWMFSNTLPL